MSRLRIAPIVEGHGEYHAIRILLHRIWYELVSPQGKSAIEILRPIRRPRSRLVQEQELGRAVRLAASKLKVKGDCHSEHCLILILLDAESDPPCQLAPQLLANASERSGGIDVCCILANVEYETWFVGAADSLGGDLDLPERIPQTPEQDRSGKGWIQRYFKRPRYSETVDQPALTSRMDLDKSRARCPSFDKLCRELEARCRD